MASEPLIWDAYGRPLDDLRVLVTPECNLDCFFCHMEGSGLQGPARPGSYQGGVMTPGDYLVLAEAAARIGIKYFRVSGGEPLVRRDICEVIAALTHTGIPVGVTTNGVLLDRYAPCLASLGVDKVNVSIHSLDPESYKSITRRPLLFRALRGVKAAINAGLRVKVNIVLLRGKNESEVKRLIELAAKLGFEVQLIELHPVGRGSKVMDSYVPAGEVLEKMGFRVVGVERGRIHNRSVLVLDNGVKVTIVDPVENPLFCAGCTRMRIRWDGGVIPCINWKREPPANVLEAIKRARSFEDAVDGVIRELEKANRWRRPFYLFPLNDGMHPARAPAGRLRLWLPGKQLKGQGGRLLAVAGQLPRAP